jgi:hypothetical protein
VKVATFLDNTSMLRFSQMIGLAGVHFRGVAAPDLPYILLATLQN